MSTRPTPLRLSLPDGSLHVDFIWQDDRFAHEFELRDGSRVASVEGTADQAWPPSPPLQQLSRELIGDRHAILGVGAAGQSHWSISVEISVDDQQTSLKFDVACRSKTDPQWLGSTYRQAKNLRIEAISGSMLTSRNGMIVVQPDRPATRGNLPLGISSERRTEAISRCIFPRLTSSKVFCVRFWQAGG